MAKTKIRDQAVCTRCADPLWEHPRCADCTRFVWCTGQDPRSPTPRHRQCPLH